MKPTLIPSMKFHFILYSMIGITCQQECDENRTETSGSFTSPFYPNNYPNNQSCTYTIDAGTTLIRLVFVDFKVENLFDKVEVFSTSGNVLASLTNRKSGYVVQPSSYYRVHFTSNSVSGRRGFNASWTIAAASLKQNLTDRIHGTCGYDGNFVRMSSSGLSLGHLEALSSATILDCMHVCRIDVFCAAFDFVGETCHLFHNIEGDDFPANVYMRM